MYEYEDIEDAGDRIEYFFRDAKPFKDVGTGVYEIVTRHATNTYRTVYAVQIGSKIYVLHALEEITEGH
jgi:phage-related protein